MDKRTYIVFQSHGHCNGSLLDCLDLYMWCIKHGLDVGLCLVEDQRDVKCRKALQYIKDLYEDRYSSYITMDTWTKKFNGIKVSNVTFIPTFIKRAIIFDYTNLQSCFTFFKMIEGVAYVSNLLKTQDQSLLSLPNMTVFHEEMFKLVGTIPYRQKYLFQQLKQSVKREDNQRSLLTFRQMTLKDVEEGMKANLWGDVRYDFSSFNYFYKSQMSYFKNFLGTASEIIYFQSTKFYDRKPRIFLEARVLNIPFYYHPLKERTVDGSLIRWENYEGDLDDREYTFDDKLIQWIIR